MSLGKKIYSKIRNRLNRYFYQKKQFKSEEEFYTYLFTKNPSWSSPEANEDETIRWSAIKTELEKIKQSKSNLEILEIGSGRGWLCKKMADYGSITGLEPVAPVVKYAKKLFPEIDFHAGFSSDFIKQFPDKKFDVIVSTEVLEHITDKTAFMQDVRTLLKPNGIIILTTPRLEHYEDSIKAFGGDPNQPVEEWMSESQLKQLLEETGFKILNKVFFAPLPNLDKTVLITQLWVGKKES